MPPVDGPPYDPDTDTTAQAIRREWDVLLAIAIGGVAGAEARYGLATALPHGSAQWPWATLVTNAAGSLLIGVLMVSLLEFATAPHRLVRPLLGVGVLGGFTTFSTFAVEVDHLVDAGRPGIAITYVAASLAACLLAVTAGAALTRSLGAAVRTGDRR